MGGRIVGRWPTYPQNTLKIGRHRIWAVLFSNLEGTSPPKFFTRGRVPSVPPLSTPMRIVMTIVIGPAGCRPAVSAGWLRSLGCNGGRWPRPRLGYNSAAVPLPSSIAEVTVTYIHTYILSLDGPGGGSVGPDTTDHRTALTSHGRSGSTSQWLSGYGGFDLPTCVRCEDAALHARLDAGSSAAAKIVILACLRLGLQ